MGNLGWNRRTSEMLYLFIESIRERAIIRRPFLHLIGNYLVTVPLNSWERRGSGTRGSFIPQTSLSQCNVRSKKPWWLMTCICFKAIQRNSQPTNQPKAPDFGRQLTANNTHLVSLSLSLKRVDPLCKSSTETSVGERLSLFSKKFYSLPFPVCMCNI